VTANSNAPKRCIALECERVHLALENNAKSAFSIQLKGAIIPRTYLEDVGGGDGG
jgi:hypothetical protein